MVMFILYAAAFRLVFQAIGTILRASKLRQGVGAMPGVKAVKETARGPLFEVRKKYDLKIKEAQSLITSVPRQIRVELN